MRPVAKLKLKTRIGNRTTSRDGTKIENVTELLIDFETEIMIKAKISLRLFINSGFDLGSASVSGFDHALDSETVTALGFDRRPILDSDSDPVSDADFGFELHCTVLYHFRFRFRINGRFRFNSHSQSGSNFARNIK
ncbi:hypothetical protein EVAR_5747_1 [Eumeta japonica]|uniref:Uncharacterized protein n=1 Tax=Eumeta variegata TaxID=151549 RepID=A0A4C1T757_EUMVA|nr:hypothetical protein EVAR_5747_1 [Eumeta japonica]